MPIPWSKDTGLGNLDLDQPKHTTNDNTALLRDKPRYTGDGELRLESLDGLGLTDVNTGQWYRTDPLPQASESREEDSSELADLMTETQNSPPCVEQPTSTGSSIQQDTFQQPTVLSSARLWSTTTIWNSPSDANLWSPLLNGAGDDGWGILADFAAIPVPPPSACRDVATRVSAMGSPDTFRTKPRLDSSLGRSTSRFFPTGEEHCLPLFSMNESPAGMDAVYTFCRFEELLLNEFLDDDLRTATPQVVLPMAKSAEYKAASLGSIEALRHTIAKKLGSGLDSRGFLELPVPRPPVISCEAYLVDGKP